MKFIYFFLPTLPATLEERKRLRPIAMHPDRWQKMIEEVTELAQVAEDAGFTAVSYPEHHLHSEGIEMGSLPVLTQHILHHTKRIMAGPIGYVLPGWNPLRLALEIAWLDQLTKGRTMVGFARGYQARWLNQMAQKVHIGATLSDKSEGDRMNREAFEEVYQFLKLAWGDEPFSFKGKYYEYPHPQEGTPWPAHEWTREYGFPGEVDEQGRIQKINVVPKPYQRPHPPLFQAFSLTEETVRWCAREGIRPTIILPAPETVRKLSDAYIDEGRKVGLTYTVGQNIGVLRSVYLGESEEQARRFAEPGMAVLGYREVFHHFGFVEAWREPADEAKYPAGKVPLPASEVTAERAQRVKAAYFGTPDDIRRGLDELVEKANPEWFVWQGDQGFYPKEVVRKQIELFGKKVLPHYV